MRAKAMQQKGLDVLAFGAGEPDFDTPPHIIDRAVEALRAGATRYGPSAGLPASREAIARKLARENGLPGVTADTVVVTAGAKTAYFLVLHALLDPPAAGEPPMEALLPVPAWVSYAPIIELAGGRVVELPTTAAGGFKITRDQLRDAIGPRTRALVLNTPSNPCGSMYTRDELIALADVIAERADAVAPDLVIVTDEIYEKIAYRAEHISIGSLAQVAERTISINGLSKAYAMTGWRVGYAAGVGPFGRAMAEALARLQVQMNTCMAGFIEATLPVALENSAERVEQMRQAFQRRAKLTCDLLEQIDGITVRRPDGAIYAFPDISSAIGRTSPGGRPIASAMDLAEALLEEELVAMVPGDEFGGVGPKHLRISFACSEEQIEAGMARLARFMTALR
ncbi:MAG: pyridoxal phosphate-dependent aminotransferase [Phycisphaerales bacterium JB039]